MNKTDGVNAHQSFSCEFDFPLRVYYEDTDAAGIVYYANYLRFCERARTECLRDLGVEQGRMLREQGIGFVVNTMQAEYKRPARLDDALNVVTTVERLGRASLVFSQKILRNQELLFDSHISIACVDTVRQRPIAIPTELRLLLQSVVP